MRTVTLEVSSREKLNRRFLRAFEGEPQGTFISFESPELLFSFPELVRNIPHWRVTSGDNRTS